MKKFQRGFTFDVVFPNDLEGEWIQRMHNLCKKDFLRHEKRRETTVLDLKSYTSTTESNICPPVSVLFARVAKNQNETKKRKNLKENCFSITLNH